LSTISQSRTQLSGAINGRINRLSESTNIEDVQLVAAGSGPCPVSAACLEIWIRNTGSIQSVIDQVYINNIAMTVVGACLNTNLATLCSPSSSTTKLSLPIQGLGAVEVSYSSSIALVTGSDTSTTSACAAPCTLDDTTKTWISNQWKNFYLQVPLGTGSASTYYLISSNTATRLTVSSNLPALDTTSQYTISCGSNTPFCSGATYTVSSSTTRGTITTGAFTV
jgi:hypothetical protein